MKILHTLFLILSITAPVAAHSSDITSVEEVISGLESSIKDDRDRAIAMVVLAQFNLEKASSLDWGTDYLEARTLVEDATLLMSRAAELGNVEARDYVDNLISLAETEPHYSVDPWLSGVAQTSARYGNTSIAAFIDTTPNGSKRVVFNFFNSLSDPQATYLCDRSFHRQARTWRFDGLAVEVATLCGKTNTSRYYTGIIMNDEDSDKVVSLLKRKPDEIVVSAEAHAIPLSAIGFTKAWNSYQQ